MLNGRVAATADGERADPWDVMLRKLCKDPSLQYSEAGRKLLRWLHCHSVRINDWNWLANAVPPHWIPSVADLARKTADSWNDFACQLERRARPLSADFADDAWM